MEQLQRLLGKIAPWLAAAAGGPPALAGMAIRTVAEALGVAPTAPPDDVSAALAHATPEQIVALKAAEQGHRERMQELGFKRETDLAAIAAGDRASARQAGVAGGTSRLLFGLSVLLLISSLGTEIALLFRGYPEGVPEIIVGRVLGLLDAIALTVMAYWFGTTAGSAQKTELLAQSVPAPPR